MNWTIGASESAAALGLSPYQSPFEWWAKKTGKVDKTETNEAMRIGIALEPAIFTEFERRYDCKLVPTKKLHNHAKEFMHATPDAFLVRDNASADFVNKLEIEKDEIIPIDFKTANIASKSWRKPEGEWGQEWSDGIPQQYLIQAQHQIDVANGDGMIAHEGFFCKRAIFFALIGERGFVPFVINQSHEIIEFIETKLEEIVSVNLDLDVPLNPETADDWDIFSDIVVRKSNGNKLRKIADNAQSVALQEYFTCAQQIKELETRKSEARTFLMQAIGKDYGLMNEKFSAVLTEGSEKEVDKPRKIVEDIKSILENIHPDSRQQIAAIINRHTEVVHRGRQLRVTERKAK